MLNAEVEASCLTRSEELRMKPLFATIATVLSILALMQNLALADQGGIQPFMEGVVGALFPLLLVAVAALLFLIAFSKNERPW